MSSTGLNLKKRRLELIKNTMEDTTSVLAMTLRKEKLACQQLKVEILIGENLIMSMDMMKNLKK
ncbi:hypothetical protein AKK44_05910 [Streptococcus phocae]|uniref:Uncharacterized protein n=1 Tax=Streptococcus phocae TaxID=119224 RepID=A0A0P6S7B3_9STRE|nr:hypothetical protein AKK44_05910 [Streptococcus phocae]